MSSFTADQNAARAAIATAKPGQRGTRYAAALRAARQVLIGGAGCDARGRHRHRPPAEWRRGTRRPRPPHGHDDSHDCGRREGSREYVRRRHRRAAHARRPIARRSRRRRAWSHRELAAPRHVRATLTLNGRPSGTREVTLPGVGRLHGGLRRSAAAVRPRDRHSQRRRRRTRGRRHVPLHAAGRGRAARCCSSCRTTRRRTRRCSSNARSRSGRPR